VLQVLLTNDDGIEADGLQALRRALSQLDDVRVVVIAPDGNRSAMARSITTRRPLWVAEVDFDDGSVGYATDGTPVDCVRLANLGLIGGFTPTSSSRASTTAPTSATTSPTRGPSPRRSRRSSSASRDRRLPAVARARARLRRPRQLRLHARGEDRRAAGRLARHGAAAAEDAAQHQRAGLRARGRRGDGARQARLSRRACASSSEEEGRRRYWIYGSAPGYEDVPGSDLAAVAAGRIALTPIHFDLTDRPGIEALGQLDLAKLLAP
jgi:5'-nucleotidase